MRFGTSSHEGRSIPVLSGETGVYPLRWDGGLRELIAAGPDVLRGAIPDGDATALVQSRLTAPLRPTKVIGIGLNYLDHIRETGMERPERPLVFAKLPTSIVGPGDSIEIDTAVTQRVDWEGELAVVVGQTLRRASADEALQGVFGYTIANDVSARDVQFTDGQWVRGKSLDTFCPLGPLIVTADEIADPQSLRIRTRVNGEVVQEASTDQMIFPVAELLSFCSHSFTLEPGDVVLTGTPWGCGEFMDPQRSLKPGDDVEVEIDRIGSLRNPVGEPTPTTADLAVAT